MKIETSKIKESRCHSLSGVSVIPECYEASVYWTDDKGSSLYVYSTAQTRREAIKALKVDLKELVKQIEELK